MKKVLMLLVVVLGGWQGEAQGQEPWSPVLAHERSEKVGVGGELEEMRALEEMIREEGGRLWIRHREEVESDDARVQMAAIRERGRELFYFEGAGEARIFLEEQLGYHLEVSRSWMADEEAMAQAYVASLYLLRALLESGEPAEGLRWARELSLLFPAHQTDQNAFPPSVLEMLELGKRDAAQVAMSLPRWEANGECRHLINGAEQQEEKLRLRSDQNYLLVVECGDRRQVYGIRILEDQPAGR